MQAQAPTRKESYDAKKASAAQTGLPLTLRSPRLAGEAFTQTVLHHGAKQRFAGAPVLRGEPLGAGSTERHRAQGSRLASAQLQPFSLKR